MPADLKLPDAQDLTRDLEAYTNICGGVTVLASSRSAGVSVRLDREGATRLRDFLNAYLTPED